MIYHIKKRTKSGATSTLQQISASDDNMANYLFAEIMADILSCTPGIRHVSYLPTHDGMVVLESDMDTALPSSPPWYISEGFYSAKNEMVMPYESPASSAEFTLSSVKVGSDYYYMEKEKLWTSIEVCAALRISRVTLLRWVKNGHITPVQIRTRPSTKKHLFSDQEVTRVMSNLPPSAPARRTI